MKQKGFTIINLVLLLLLFCAVVGGALWFIKNKKVEVTQITWKVEIIDGDIYKVGKNGEKGLLVDKRDFSSESIQEFLSVEMSPDGSKLCFIGKSIVPWWLYYANSDGSNPVKIGLGKNCVWSHDSSKIAYNNHTTDISPVNVLVYDTTSKKLTNTTQKIQSEDVIRSYELPKWSKDDSVITSLFSFLAMDGTGASGKGVSEINLITGEILDK